MTAQRDDPVLAAAGADRDPATRPPRRRGRALPLLFAALATLAVLAVLGGIAVVYGRTQLEAPAASHDDQVVVTVQPGEGVGQLADDLYADHLIKSSFWFSWFARFKGLGGELQPGNYRLDSGMGASAIIAKLGGAPDVQVRRVVLPEGLTAEQMAARIEAATGIHAADYLAAARTERWNDGFLAGLAAGGSAGVEGFLFPDTYQIPDGATAHDVVRMQLDTFAAKAAPRLGRAPRGLTAYQVVVLASIVEREARRDQDRPLVAGVLYNRVTAGTLLQVDASVMYGLDKVGQNPTSADLKLDTPYNTYLHPGLPPTPIGNPGLAALTAASAPASTPFMYYVSDGCGVIHYARTEAEQERNSREFVGTPCASPSSTP